METISYELANRLDKLGINKKSILAWMEMAPMLDAPPEVVGWTVEHENRAKQNGRLYLHAYTLDEILEMLPEIIINDYAYMWERISFDKSPTDSAGELLAWCIENGHVKVRDL